jgi:hypothetical protein
VLRAAAACLWRALRDYETLSEVVTLGAEA